MLRRSPSIERIPEDARRILLHLAGKLWGGDVEPGALAVSQLRGAMTNEPGGEGDPRKVLVRIYGQVIEVFFDRADEVRTFECMSCHGLGPCHVGRFANGRVEESINARTLSAADLRDPEISALIARKLREFHDLRHVLFYVTFSYHGENARVRCSQEESKQFQLNKLGDQIALLEKALSGVNQSVGFCHNDLQYGNIMIYEETRQVTLIDYEYASFNPVAFDIANHFSEMAADYHTSTPHVLDFAKYPDIQEQRRFVQTYLSSSGEHLCGFVVSPSPAFALLRSPSFAGAPAGKNPEPLQEQTVFSVRTIDVASHSPSSSIHATTSTPATRSHLVGVGGRAIIVTTGNAVHQRRPWSFPAACEVASDEAKASHIILSPADDRVLSFGSSSANS
ncbi:hypothetical protein C2845_PM12G08530 [Panicum miliaceum]|uniref:Choline kinase 2 n=1 Tax=Panicum miliaceum TaxID=4540 RepID=A0A3L6QHA3_PANMI|nr:hypothetical protein C2845_PM12G08530 [Panicum miliaceum]